MDPNANWAEQVRILTRVNRGEDADLERLEDLRLALSEWVARGGFFPRSWCGAASPQWAPREGDPDVIEEIALAWPRCYYDGHENPVEEYLADLTIELGGRKPEDVAAEEVARVFAHASEAKLKAYLEERLLPVDATLKFHNCLFDDGVDEHTQEEFDAALEKVLDGMTGAQIIATPGAYEVFSEDLNNHVLAVLRGDA